MGWFYILLGLLCNRWLIGWLFASHGAIESRSFNLALLGIQIGLIGFGLLCLRFKESRLLALLSNLGVTGLSILLMFFALDWGIGRTAISQQLAHVAHEPNLNFRIENLEFAYQFRTNSQGLRDVEMPLRKPAGVTRIVVVGDSYVEGSGVEAEESFSSRIEELAATEGRKIEMVNCGLSGTGTLQHARILFHLCLNYEPDAVIIAVHANDVTETLPDTIPDQIYTLTADKETGLPGILQQLWPRLFALWQRAKKNLGTKATINLLVTPLYAQDSATSESASKTVRDVVAEARRRGYDEQKIQAWIASLPPDLLTAADQNRFNGYILAAGLLKPTYWTESLDIAGDDAEKQFTAMMRIHEAMVEGLRQRQIPVAMLYLPSPFQFDARYGEAWRQTGTTTRAAWATQKTELEIRLETWAQNQQLPYFSTTANFHTLIQADPTTDWYYPLDGHYTAAGHSKVAEWVWQWVKESGVKSQKSEVISQSSTAPRLLTSDF